MIAETTHTWSHTQLRTMSLRGRHGPNERVWEGGTPDLRPQERGREATHRTRGMRVRGRRMTTAHGRHVTGPSDDVHTQDHECGDEKSSHPNSWGPQHTAFGETNPPRHMCAYTRAHTDASTHTSEWDADSHHQSARLGGACRCARGGSCMTTQCSGNTLSRAERVSTQGTMCE